MQITNMKKDSRTEARNEGFVECIELRVRFARSGKLKGLEVGCYWEPEPGPVRSKAKTD
jgi:hypothetical protein